VDASDVIADLTAESTEVDALVADLPADQWRRDTPAAGWTIAHQVAHLAWTDQAALLSIRDPDAFTAHLGRAAAAPESFVDRGAEETIDEPPRLLATWRAGRAELTDALSGLPQGSKVLWYGTSMSPASMATARIMETWAHGLDIADALGITRVPTARLRHICYLGHRTLGFSFLAHGRPLPTAPVQLRLTAPDGALWTFGPDGATDMVDGPALDFCLLVTQRRHRSDLALTATGPVADAWLDVAQAFAGPPGAGREPRA
jgi:uncharacterized protein (TIGR03084 family)